MNATLADLYTILHPHIDPILVNDVYWQRIQTIAQGLPMLRFGMFECRLEANEPAVDLMLGVIAEGGDQERERMAVLDDYGPYLNDPSAVRSWEELRAFCKTWMDPQSYLSGIIPNIIVVFDIAEHEGRAVPPWVYVVFEQMALPTHFKRSLASLVMDEFSMSYAPGTKDKMTQVFEAVEDPAYVFSVGMMAPRNDRVLRFGVYPFTQEKEITHFLEKIDWPGDSTHLLSTLAQLTPMTDHQVLGFDITEGVQPRVSVELVLSHKDHRQQAQQMIETVVKRGWCTDTKAKAMLQWIGESRAPYLAQWTNQVFGPSPYVYRWINHIKLAFGPGEQVAAKGYLYYRIKHTMT